MFGRKAMLGKKKAPVRLQDAADLAENFSGIGHAAQRPGDDDVVDACVFQRYSLGQTFDQFHVRLRAARRIRGYPQQFRGRIEADHAYDLAGIERKIEPRTDADLENTSLCPRNRATAIGRQLFLPHRHMREARQNVFIVEAHINLAIDQA